MNIGTWEDEISIDRESSWKFRKISRIECKNALLYIPLVLAQSVLRELLKFKKFTLLLRSPVVKVQHSNSSVTAIYRDPTAQQLVSIKGNLDVSIAVNGQFKIVA
jgi:hypothetical protein